MKKLLVTGGAGFIGSNFINYMLSVKDDIEIVNLDKLTYAGNLENLIPSQSLNNYHFVKGDITDSNTVDDVFKKFKITHVINFAAESHVDRSILGSKEFFTTNVIGTNVLLEVAKNHSVEKFIQIGTDEAYGSLGTKGKFTEQSQIKPNSPYSSSKASADLMALSFFHTYGMPIIVTRCSNNYGPFQFPEKLIPLMIINALNNKPLPIYGDGLNVRDWIYVIDHNTAVEAVLDNGMPGEVYNIGANQEMKNIEIVKLILNKLNKSEDLIKFVKDRPGHDRRYAIDSTKIETKLNWKPNYKFEEAIESTINWYLENKSWWERIISGEYQNYYDEQYSTRI